MKILTKGNEAEDFYRERYGIDISAFDRITRSSLENLYFRGVRLSPGKLYAKLEQCGISLHRNAVSRVRRKALNHRILKDNYRKMYSSSTASARNAAAMRQPLSEEPQTK